MPLSAQQLAARDNPRGERLMKKAGIAPQYNVLLETSVQWKNP